MATAKRLEDGTPRSETPEVRRFLKGMAGLALIPFCYGAASAVWRMLSLSGSADATWVPIVAGAICWGVIYLLLPRPMWLYVAGHELTHVLWTWVFGGKVRQLRVSSKGGHVVVTRSNFIISLAPYFFPFYAAALVVLFLAAQLCVARSRLEVWFLLLLGMAYAFHLTLTGHVLRSRQTDVTDHGYIFSAAIIALGNLAVLVVAIPTLTATPPLATAFLWCWEGTRDLVGFIYGWIANAVGDGA